VNFSHIPKFEILGHDKNQRLVSWLSLKTNVVEGFPVLVSKPATPVWWFRHQNHRDGFLVWASKPSGLWFVSCVTKSTEEDRRGHTSRSSSLLVWKQVWVGFPSLTWRLRKARRQVVHMAPSRRLRRRQVEDERVDATGCIGAYYPTIAVFNVLDHRGIVVI
jgi:hypothetical protein